MAIVDRGKVVTQGPLDDIRRLLVVSRQVTARVSDDAIDTVIDLLRARPEVSEVAAERGIVRFVLAGDSAESAATLRLVVESGVDVSEWRVQDAGLEELFMQLTEDGDI
jgi:ABC-type multidrug transport system ATPase subunit